MNLLIMQWYEALIILVTGFISGFINVVAGGGSLLSLPVMIFLGLPPVIANASNRVAIFSQNIFGILGFKSKGVSAYPYSLYLGLSALLGAIFGAKISVELNEVLFNKIIAAIMVMVILFTIFGPVRHGSNRIEKMGAKHKLMGMVLFFFIGIYGGFIQAGVGFLIIAALTGIHHMDLVKTNSAKVFIVFVYTIASLTIFILEGVINWQFGITLAVGNSIGGWVASRWSVNKGERWIKRILAVTVIALAVKLWFFTG